MPARSRRPTFPAHLRLVAAAAAALAALALPAAPARAAADPPPSPTASPAWTGVAAQVADTQTRLVDAAYNFEQARMLSAQARAQATADRTAASAAARAADRQRRVLDAYAAQLYRTGPAGTALLTTLFRPGAPGDLMQGEALLQQVGATQQTRVAQAQRALAAATRAAAEAANAERSAATADARTTTLFETLRAAAERLAADLSTRSAATRAAASAAAQQARETAVTAHWRDYLAQLAAAGVTPPPAAALADPARPLPPGLTPLVDAAGNPVPGVARAVTAPRTLTVLPAETVTAVSAALAALGQPYAPGQAGPASYDCGGLVAAAWATAGVRLAGQPAAQWAGVRPVPQVNLQVGDLVFLAAPDSGVYQVALYLGGGFTVEASATSYRVGVGQLPAQIFAAGRATLPGPGTPNPAPPTPARPALRCGAPPSPVSAQGWTMPVPPGTYRLGAPFGETGPLWGGGVHTGLDFPAVTGTPVLAATDGVVTVEQPAWAGNLIRVRQTSGVETWYAHLSAVDVTTGQRVSAGQRIGAVGAEGNVTGPHLHFEVRVNGQPVDPLPLLLAAAPGPAAAPARR